MFITHDFGVVAEIADRVAVMQHGRLVEAGPAAKVLNAPAHPYTKSLIAAVPSLTPRAARPIDGAPVRCRCGPREDVSGAGERCSARGTRRARGPTTATLVFAPGETLGIVGESGSGKSTLARCIVRLVDADAGCRSRARRRRAARTVAAPAAPLPPAGADGVPGSVRLARTRGSRWATSSPKARSCTACAATKPLRRAGELIWSSSGSTRVAVALSARVLRRAAAAHRHRARARARPEVLVADEPVSALDVSVQAQVLQLLADIRDRCISRCCSSRMTCASPRRSATRSP